MERNDEEEDGWRESWNVVYDYEMASMCWL